jgi:hypothetical protein
VLLLAADPAAWWTAEAAARELRAPASWVAAQLGDLVAEGVARTDDEDRAMYRFDAGGPWAEAIRDIGALYPKRRTSIIRLIFAPASSDVQSFSDAFRLRPEQEGED